MTFNIQSIGIEFEFEIPSGINDNIKFAQQYVLEYNVLNPDFTIDVDREYYSNQIEFKLRRTTDILGGISHFQEFIISCYNKFSYISCVGNPFVGTHIHLFLEKDGVAYDGLARGKKMPIADFAYDFFSKWLGSNPLKLKRSVIYLEAKRLAMNHNILRHFDTQYLKNGIKRQLESIGLNYPMFHRGIHRPKYAPVIWSLANPTSGKPHSIEIRAIPNSWFLMESPHIMYDFINHTEFLLNKKERRGYGYISSILSSHKKLLLIMSSKN